MGKRSRKRATSLSKYGTRKNARNRYISLSRIIIEENEGTTKGESTK